MKEDEFGLDKLPPDVRSWLSLVTQARRTSEGEIVPSFLKIIKQIDSELNSIFKNRHNLVTPWCNLLRDNIARGVRFRPPPVI